MAGTPAGQIGKSPLRRLHGPPTRAVARVHADNPYAQAAARAATAGKHPKPLSDRPGPGEGRRRSESRGLMRKRKLVAGAGVLAGLAAALVQRRSAYDFRGKTALITGGSRGLGLLLAEE